VGITFSRISTSSWTIKPWFLTEKKACCYIHHTLLLGFSNWPVIYSASSLLTRGATCAAYCCFSYSQFAHDGAGRGDAASGSPRAAAVKLS
jgi:hypothetical protein